MNYDNLPQPPEGVLDPEIPWSRINPNSRLWVILKARLTGRPTEQGHYHSHVNISEADADRLIENLKKDPRGYPSVDQTSGTPNQWIEREEKYERWLVEEYLEKPFREEVNEKIDAKTSDVLDRVFIEAKEEVKEAETTEEVVEILEDKKEILEDIQEKISPPPTEYKIPDPWEESYTTPETPKTEKKKPKRRRLKRPQGVVKKPKKKPSSKKKKPSAPPPTPETKRKRFGKMVGGGLKKAGGFIGKTLFSGGSGGGGGGAEGEGPSILAAGAWLGKKVKKAFQDAKEEKERALEAQSNGAELPPETFEPGYFLKKSIGYQFGGRAFDTSFGAFIEKMPSKQSSSKAGFGDKFDYGDADPKKKKKKTNELRDLATGFRKVSIALGSINKQITKQTQTLSQLVTSSERNADLLESISNSIAGLVAVEIDSGSDEMQAQQAASGDVNIPSLDFSGLLGKSEGGFDWFDLLMAGDDIRDLKKGIQNKAGQKTTRRSGGKPRITGDVTPRRRFRMPSFGRRMKFSQGTAAVGTQVPALIGEAGPEMLVRGGVKKLAEGGVLQGTGSNILATGLGAAGDLMKKVQPFANVMEMPFKVIGAQISGALASLVSAAGPFSGVIAKMFSPLLGGLATIFGLNQGAFAAEINSAAMTEEQGAKTLSKFFANFFKLFGFDIDNDEDRNTDDEDTSGVSPGVKGLLDFIARYESGGDYNKIFGGQSIPELTGKTIREVVEIQKRHNAAGYESAAIGRYQIMHPEEYAAKVGLSLDDKFSEANQDKMAMQFLKEDGWEDYISGKLDAETFADRVAGTWAALPTRDGQSAHQGVGSNRSLVSRDKYMAQIRAAKEMKSGGVVPTISNSFANQVQGVFEMSGPDTGYKVPEDLTGGQPVIGHGLEWLVKLSNKFIILPGVNKEYNVYQNPEKAFNRYEQIGKQGGVEVAGLVNFIDNLLSPPKTGRTPVYGEGFPKTRTYKAYDEDGAEILRILGGTPVKGAMLNDDMPEANVTPLPIPKDTVSDTSVAMVQTIIPVIQQVPVYIKGDTQYINVPADPLVAAREKARLSHYTSIT